MAEQQIPAEEISELVDRFYAKVRLDEEIGPIFNATIDDWPAHLALLKKHLPLLLDPPHFERWLALFEETAREVMLPEHADVIIEKSHRIAQNFQSAIAYHREGKLMEQGIWRATDSSKC